MAELKEKERSAHHPTTDELEDELEQVREELDRRASRRALTQLAAGFALLLSFAALLAVAFKVQDNSDSAAEMHGRMAEDQGPAVENPGPAPGMSGMSSGAAETGDAAGRSGAIQRVRVSLGDFTVSPDAGSVPAGKVEFIARNVGRVEHELMVERMPMKMDGPMQPNEEAAQGMIDHMDPGESGRMTLNLKPGTYVLFCNVPGHYAAGQHTQFRVTG